MKKFFLSALAFCCLGTTSWAQTPSLFKPYQSTNLRLPSVPLVVSDPYFSIWSPYDRLTDGTTRHWTNDEKPLEGLIRVDGTTYRWMGAPRNVLESIVPMADEQAWEGEYTNKPQTGSNWTNPSFDAQGWQHGKAAWGSKDLSFVRTSWSQENSDLYVRRSFKLSANDLKEDLFLVYSHDDVFEIYINETKVAETGETWVDGVQLKLDSSLKALLHEGENVIAAHCHNTTGGAYTDFGLFKNISKDKKSIHTAQQLSVDVLATNTYYTFACGPVELDVVFTAPMLIDDYDLLSSPINYISYQVRSTDGLEHDIQIMINTTPEMAVNKASQPTRTEIIENNGTTYARTGTIDQPILAHKGDGICIDWGYCYLPAINGEVSIGDANELRETFMETGRAKSLQTTIDCNKPSRLPLLCYVHSFGRTRQASSFMMIGYDELQDIEYMYKRYQAYWAHGGKVSIFQMFNQLEEQYSSIMQRCRDFDQRIYDDGLQAGNAHYAEMLSATYRHVIAAHKLFQDDQGNLLFFSKENNSNGCVNTVDLTYPEAPLFLIYNPELQKAMMTSIFDYSASGRWTKPFAAHDLGTYPIANGQVYGGDMPLEEAGNMLILAAQLCRTDGNTLYVDKYWDIITTWADYLVENGQDPENQLCTDDFAGHWAHNANLSVKAIMGVTAYAEMARLKGLNEIAGKYLERARTMAQQWEKDAREDDHFRLAFDRKDTWSQKYNMVWDKLWQTKIFSEDVMQREMKYYLKKQNRYGLPLDIRKDYSKNDWILWTAAMSKDKKTFLQFMEPVYNYMNETESRVPTSDWYDTKTGKMIGFKARSVIGGFWMKVLMDKSNASRH
ncbi:MAG: DUF4965 domain-containing protein [Prevotella sp.]|nr:DUF4965 domain-containing protein [Prevotella sp.]